MTVRRLAPLGLNAEGSHYLKGFLDGKLRVLAHCTLDQIALVRRQRRDIRGPHCLELSPVH